MRFPSREEVAPRVAEEPTMKNTLLASAPLVSRTWDKAEVVRVVVTLKIHWPLGFVAPFRVRVPVFVTPEEGKV